MFNHFRTKTNAAPAALEIPATLRDSLAMRLDHLGMAKETAQWAAVLGREFSYAILQASVPYDEQRLQSDMARLIETDLVSPITSVPQAAPSGGWAAQGKKAVPRQGPAQHYLFKHALIQEAAYASLLKRTRMLYHQQAAETIEKHFPQIAETRPEILAQHLDSAGLPSKAVEYWLRAGERTKAQGATLEARTFFERALQAVPAEDREQRWLGAVR